MTFTCTICGALVELQRPDDKPLPEDMQVCYKCEKKRQRKKIKSELGYSRVGLKNI